MYLPSRNSNRSAKLIINSCILSSFLVTFAYGFNQSSLPSTRGKPPPLYYIDHDPIIERSIKVPPVKEIATLDEPMIKSPRKKSTTKRQKSESKLQSNRGVQDRTWDERYQSLLEFKQQHGHCLVPQNYPPDPKLGLWVMAQRGYFTKTTGLNDRHRRRYEKLKEADFVFRVDRRGPRMAKLQDNNRGGSIQDMDDFVAFMIENKDRISEEEKRDAWKTRFSVFEK